MLLRVHEEGGGWFAEYHDAGRHLVKRPPHLPCPGVAWRGQRRSQITIEKGEG